MRNKEDLFHLIKAMSRSEKRYFVLDAKKSGRTASRYLNLFNALNNMEEFDEDKLKKKFSKNLSSDKAYLYESILRSMRDYRSASSRAAQVKERLVDARYLYERGLYDQSTGRIAEAKSMALELEDHFTLLEINKEEQVSLFDRRARVTLDHIEQLNAEREERLRAIREELEYLDLYYRLLIEVLREYQLKDTGSIDALKKRVPLELLSDKKKPSFPQAVRRFYQCNAAYYMLLGETEKVFDYYLKTVEWWDRYPALREEEFHRYIIDVSNFVNASYKVEGHSAKGQEWQEKLTKEKAGKSYHNQRIIFLKLSITNLLQALNQGDFENAHAMLPEIIDGLNKFGLRKSMVLTGNIVTVYFLVSDYRNCIFWADHIIRNLKNAGREDIQRIIRVYKLISLYELGEVDALDRELRSVQRYFKSMKIQKGQFEEQLLNHYLRRIFYAPISDIRGLKKELTTYLTDLQSDAKSANLLGIDELLIYLKKT